MFDAIGIEWLILSASQRYKRMSEEELVARLEVYSKGSIKFRLVEDELESRGLLDKHNRESAKSWI